MTLILAISATLFVQATWLDPAPTPAPAVTAALLEGRLADLLARTEGPR